MTATFVGPINDFRDEWATYDTPTLRRVLKKERWCLEEMQRIAKVRAPGSWDWPIACSRAYIGAIETILRERGVKRLAA